MRTSLPEEGGRIARRPARRRRRRPRRALRVGRRRWVLSEPTGYAARLPIASAGRAAAHDMRNAWYRIDAQPSDEWTWDAYPAPRSRFDSATGDASGFAMPVMRRAWRCASASTASNASSASSALDSHLTELTGPVERPRPAPRPDARRTQAGRPDQHVVARVTSGRPASSLIDLVHDWFGERCDGLVYRSRTTPERSANLAFFAHAPLTVRGLGALRRPTSNCCSTAPRRTDSTSAAGADSAGERGGDAAGAGDEDGRDALAGGAAEALDRARHRDRGQQPAVRGEHRRRHRGHPGLALGHRLRPAAPPHLGQRARR